MASGAPGLSVFYPRCSHVPGLTSHSPPNSAPAMIDALRASRHAESRCMMRERGPPPTAGQSDADLVYGHRRSPTWGIVGLSTGRGI